MFWHTFGLHARKERPPCCAWFPMTDTTGLRDEAVLNLDWRHDFTQDTLEPHAEQRLRSALASASAALKAVYGACEITLAVKAHFPVAVTIGNAFSEPTGCTLLMPRDGLEWIVARARARGRVCS